VESSDVNIDLVFEHDYSIREVDDFEIADAPIHEFTGHSWLDKPPSFSILVSPVDMPEWVGRFEIAYGVPPATSGVYATPRQDRVCVVAGGQGIVIDVRNPKNFDLVACFPINSVAQSPTTTRLVFADFTSLEAWDANGKVWDSGRVALDELEIVRVDTSSVFCRCCGLGPNYHFEFDVDLMDGTIIGGGRRFIAADKGDDTAIEHFATDIELEQLREDFS
jgi:hypothetical protein